MRRVFVTRVHISAAILLFTLSSAQPVPRLTGADPSTIDCPPKTLFTITGTALSVRSAVWRVDGVIRNLNLRDRTLDVDGVPLQIDVRTVILVDCQRAPMRELREGSSVTALYRDRGDRHIVIVIEGESDDQ